MDLDNERCFSSIVNNWNDATESAIISLFKPFPWAPVDTVPVNESPGPDVTFSKTRYFSGCLGYVRN
jgi:hypothetical protein